MVIRTVTGSSNDSDWGPGIF